ncbi:MAG: hypothetical protein KC420_21720 [Myxococcales bacterium]|nr:hypothetical protein [Myxococcales bacterium]
MAELPECYRPLADRQGLIPVGALPVREVRRALKTSLSTMDAAIRLFNALVDRLGAAAYVDPAAAAPGRRLHLRDRDDPSWLVPQPLIEIRPMEHVRGGTLAMIRTGPDIPSEDRPEGWQPGDPPWFPKPPLPEIVPRGPTMFAGALLLREGPATIEIRYDERGVLCESTVSGGDSFWAVRAPGRLPFMIDPSSRGASVRPHSLLCRGDLHDHLAADELAAMLAETEQPSRVGFRVWLPVPLPHGPAGVLEGARRGIRAALA